MDRPTDGEMDRLADGQSDRQRQMNRPTDGEMEGHKACKSNKNYKIIEIFF
jgi:hypothetical protein